MGWVGSDWDSGDGQAGPCMGRCVGWCMVGCMAWCMGAWLGDVLVMWCCGGRKNACVYYLVW